MATVVKNPLSDFRALSNPAVGVKATATTTAPTAPANPPNSNNTPYLVVTDVTACLVAGTSAQTAVAVNLIDGTSGGTNVQWTANLGALAGSMADQVFLSGLNIPCRSGFATLEFATAGSTSSFESVAFGGYYQGGYNQ